MCPDLSPKLLARQRGFLLPLALFMVVALGLLALGLWRTSAQTNIAAVQELISVQAFYAAESGAQVGMSRLFYPNASIRQQIDQRCLNLNETLNFSVIGLNNCSAAVSCQCEYSTGTACDPTDNSHYQSGTANRNSFYRISSDGNCGSGGISAARTVEVGAQLQQE